MKKFLVRSSIAASDSTCGGSSPKVKIVVVTRASDFVESLGSVIRSGTAFQVGTTVPSITKAISGRRGSLVSTVACWRNGPPTPFPVHWMLTVVSPPGATVFSPAVSSPLSVDGPRSLTVQVQLVAPRVSTRGAVPRLRITKACCPFSPEPTEPKWWVVSAASTWGAGASRGVSIARKSPTRHGRSVASRAAEPAPIATPAANATPATVHPRTMLMTPRIPKTFWVHPAGGLGVARATWRRLPCGVGFSLRIRPHS